jgi:phospholipid transport system substrate-binding protein
VLASVKADPAIQADVNRIVSRWTRNPASINFARMTSSAVGRFWRQATW